MSEDIFSELITDFINDISISDRLKEIIRSKTEERICDIFAENISEMVFDIIVSNNQEEIQDDDIDSISIEPTPKNPFETKTIMRKKNETLH